KQLLTWDHRYIARSGKNHRPVQVLRRSRRCDMAARKKARKPGRAERSERSQAIHANLDKAAAAINDLHARVLADVIEARVWNIYRDVDGFSGLRDWLMERFDFHMRVAADLAVIA